jgi:hypothetical protein
MPIINDWGDQVNILHYICKLIQLLTYSNSDLILMSLFIIIYCNLKVYLIV